jgi:hypothetical protein
MKRKVLITVKTYPNPSKNYIETVCTAGIDEEGNWLRVYPVIFRQRDVSEQYKKWDWVTLDIVKNDKDFRPESYKLVDVDQDITIDSHIGTNDWGFRKELLLKNVYTSMLALIDDSFDESKNVSIAVFKAKEIKRAFYEAVEKKDWSDEEKAKMDQRDLFIDREINPLKKLPLAFGLEFVDANDSPSKMRILDWEIGQLFWKCYGKNGNEAEACAKVIEKLNWIYQKRELYLFLGTTLEFHRRKAPNPFTIIGLFYPPKDDQLSIF